MKAVILAGGLGTRLKPFTEAIPKPLLPIGEKAVLEIQIEHLRNNGFDEIFLATNYKSAYIENFFGDGSRYGIRLLISKEEKQLGTAGPIKLLAAELNEPFLVMNGDILTNLDFSEFYKYGLSQPSDLSITIKKMVMPYAFGNIFFDGDRVTEIQEKPDIVTYALAGIYFMRPAILDRIPNNTYFGMDSLMKEMLSNNEIISKYELNSFWLDIGRIDDYEKAQEDYFTYFTTNQNK
jgi:NDP-mannose synthase